MRSTDRITGALRGRKKAVTFIGAAAALVGAGTASAATIAAAPAHAAPARAAAISRSAPRVRRSDAAPVRAREAAPRPAAAQQAARPQSVNVHTWARAQAIVASQTGSSEPKAADRLQPVSTAAAQESMQLSPAQLANAKVIVEQALAKKMGVRSAVIAVATSMQESMLTNINYGDQDSLGLFQQRPSCGWGSAHQLLDPKFAADAFLTALKAHQDSDPSWVHQPLWANAQAVQASGFPTAYAKWEAQAEQLVKQIVTDVR